MEQGEKYKKKYFNVLRYSAKKNHAIELSAGTYSKMWSASMLKHIINAVYDVVSFLVLQGGGVRGQGDFI